MSQARRWLFRVLLSAAIVMTAAVATADADGRRWRASRPLPQVEVTVTRLTATGPDGNRHELYHDPAGVKTGLRRLESLQRELQDRPYGPDGAYHTLTATYADRFRLIRPDGTGRAGRLTEEGRPLEQRIRGMVLVRDGRMQPLGMGEPPRRPVHRGGRKDEGYGDDD